MSRSYIAAFCSTHGLELDGNGDCAECEAAKPVECHCCGATTVPLFPYEGHVECNACSGLGDELQAERLALVTLLARVAALAPKTRKVAIETTGEEIRGAA